MTPIADAYMDSVPMVAITSRVPSAAIGTDAFQEADISGITVPITKPQPADHGSSGIPRAIAGHSTWRPLGVPAPCWWTLPRTRWRHRPRSNG